MTSRKIATLRKSPFYLRRFQQPPLFLLRSAKNTPGAFVTDQRSTKESDNLHGPNSRPGNKEREYARKFPRHCHPPRWRRRRRWRHFTLLGATLRFTDEWQMAEIEGNVQRISKELYSRLKTAFFIIIYNVCMI